MSPYMRPEYPSQREMDLEESTYAAYRARSLIDSAAQIGGDDPCSLGIDHAIVDELQRIDRMGKQYRDSMFPRLDYQEVLEYAIERLGEERANYIEYQARKLQGDEQGSRSEAASGYIYVCDRSYGSIRGSTK